MATMVDGLGFEELGDVSDPGSKVNSLWTTGSIVTQSNVDVAGNVSGAANIYGDNFYENGTKELHSALLGSATTQTWGGLVQAGSFDTGAGSQGVVSFGTPYASATSYYVTVTATGSATGFEDSYISGARNASGVDFVGAASLRYDWIAVGAI